MNPARSHTTYGAVALGEAARRRPLPERLDRVWTLILLFVDALAILGAAYAVGVPPTDAPATALVGCAGFALCGVYQISYAVVWRDEIYHVFVGCVTALLPLWALLHLVAGLSSALPVLTLILGGAVIATMHALLHRARHDLGRGDATASYVSPQAQWRLGSTAFRIWKSLFDTILAAVALLLLSPVLSIAAAAILVESGAPVFFRQERIGRGGKTFAIYKFRTMHRDADGQWARPGDRRITRVGGFLRRTSIDELPQLFNVLRGEMSLVGPRPEMESFARNFSYTIPHYEERHLVEPGLTGWAQTRCKRNFQPSEVASVVPYDLFYLEHASPVLDAIIVLKTAAELPFHRAV